MTDELKPWLYSPKQFLQKSCKQAARVFRRNSLGRARLTPDLLLLQASHADLLSQVFGIPILA
jgi:hypothetical protein